MNNYIYKGCEELIYFIFIILLGLIFLYLKNKTRNIDIELSCKKIVCILDKFLLIAPIIGFSIFTILFTTLLKGKILERASHAFCLLFLWIIATSFYTEIMKHYRNKSIILISIVSIIVSVTLAIILTPLDKYNLLIYSQFNTYAFALGTYLMIVFYTGFFLNKRDNS